MFLYDYHMHSTNSTDGKNSVMEMCAQAVKNGLNEIAFTDHFEPQPGKEDYRIYNPFQLMAEIHRARKIFGHKLKILVGIELGQPHHFPVSSERVLTSIPYDYVLASAHKFKNGCDVGELNYSEWDLNDLYTVYSRELKALVQWGKFDCVGHIDLIKRYCTCFYNSRVTLAICRDMLEDVLKSIIYEGKGIEINTSGLRQQPKETYPGIDILKLYRQLGGEILTLGSDAHNTQELGRGLIEAVKLAEKSGFSYLTTFENRKPRWIPINKLYELTKKTG